MNNNSIDEKDLVEIQKIIKYKFNNINYLITAFTHPSTLKNNNYDFFKMASKKLHII